MASNDIDKMVQDALNAAKQSHTTTLSKSTSSLISLHTRLITNSLKPNLVRDKNGIYIQKNGNAIAAGTHMN